MTDLNAFAESCPIGARKFPAAPALEMLDLTFSYHMKNLKASHYKVDSAQFLCTPIRRTLQTRHISHVNASKTQNLCAGSAGLHLFGGSLGLFDITSNDARVGSEMDEGLHLCAADRASTSRTKHHFVC
jgi:hypothetical protein